MLGTNKELGVKFERVFGVSIEDCYSEKMFDLVGLKLFSIDKFMEVIGLGNLPSIKIADILVSEYGRDSLDLIQRVILETVTALDIIKENIPTEEERE